MLKRRELLKIAAFARIGERKGALHGILPTLSAPSDIEREIDFINRSGAHGAVWPWSALSLDKRMAGAEIVMGGVMGPVILCVQGDDLRSTRRLARQAEKLKPSAVLAAPLGDAAKLMEHYHEIAGACGAPLMAHVAGRMSVEFVLRARDEIPTLRFVKDEAGHTLSRISEYKRAAPDLTVFTGGAGRTMPDEIERGASGAMPPARLAAAYVRIWNDCLAGHREKAIAGLTALHCASLG